MGQGGRAIYCLSYRTSERSERRSGIQRKYQKAQPFADRFFNNKEQNASRFGIYAGSRRGARRLAYIFFSAFKRVAIF
jgi:hypothetical protein